MNKILVVGAGFSGSVIARELAERGFLVDIFEKRNHIGGNAYDYINENGIRIHKYGPHLFHTSNLNVVEWLSKFTEWTPYKHKVKALLENGKLVTLPVNKETAEIVGEENIFDIFFRPYTKKMWGIDINEIDAEVLSRVPIRNDLNEFYFPNDSFQSLPSNGYTGIFEKILDHEKINVHLNKEFKQGDELSYFHTFNSMPIDEYFNFIDGDLPYRSIKFHTSTINVPQLFPTATINFTHNEPYTRVTEWKNLPNSGKPADSTTITVEEPCDYRDNNLERYYPIKDKDGINHKLYESYKSKTPHNMTFIGRCGMYAYLDMHQAISSSLSIAKKFIEKNKL
jgi:UDP-galactopyranose mutase